MNFSKDACTKIIDNLYDGLYLLDKERTITYWNKSAEKISGFKADEVIGRSCSDNILTHVDADGNSLCQGMCPLAAVISDGIPREAEVYMHHKDGHRIPVLIRGTPLTDEKGTVIGGIELFTDISHQAGYELRIKELEKLAMLDSLTQLANRRYLEKEIRNRLEEKKRFQIPFGILLMDIDHFKHFNDTYGHDTGDEVLKYIAQTFIHNSRPFDMYGRWGGEEFLGIIRNIDTQALWDLGNRLRLLVQNSYLIRENKKLKITISMGATLVKVNDTIESVIKRADQLMYESKQKGRNSLTLG
ncbi:MAG: sensor domain-containing diguanylate cyclase [Deltaproteobacteria bacterium]|nr:sensor domain-containing diguanylate cyclase [Deltaproteobacteria bacterium]